MQNLSRFLIAIVSILIVGSVVWIVSEQTTESVVEVPAPDLDTVAASIFPIYDITRNIAGSDLNVELILPPGASPHTFEASPSIIRSLGDTDVIYAVGYELDSWASTLAESQGAEVIQVDERITIRSEEEEHEEEEDEHGHGEFDPHYWLSIKNAKQIARNISTDLSIRYPDLTPIFEANLDVYLEELEEAAQQMDATLASLENRSIVTFHDAWYYFTEEFGLEIVGTYEPTAAREPTPKYLAELTAGLKAAGTTTIFSEPQFGTANLEAFAQDNNLTIVELDPIGGEEGRDSYIELMHYNVNTIAQSN